MALPWPTPALSIPRPACNDPALAPGWLSDEPERFKPMEDQDRELEWEMRNTPAGHVLGTGRMRPAKAYQPLRFETPNYTIQG